MPRILFLKVILVYYAIAAVVFTSAQLFSFERGLAVYGPMLVSVLLIVPIYLWQTDYRATARISNDANGRKRSTVIFWVLALFFLALSVRIPSVLLWQQPYEKTPLIALLVLTMLLLEKTDLTAFGFKTRSIVKTLVYGGAFFTVLGGSTWFTLESLVHFFAGRTYIQSYNVVPFLLQMPFMTLCVGISEEGLFRGYIQTHLERVLTSKQAILAQAILFGIWHFVWNLYPFNGVEMVAYVASSFLFGLIFGYFYSKSRNLIPLILAHGLWNSVPPGFVTNQSALQAAQLASSASRVLVWVMPLVIPVFLAFLFIKYTVKGT